MSDPEGIGLADALEVLRSELAEAREKAARSDVQFPVESVTVELKVAVTKSADGKAGFTVPLIGAEFGGSGGFSREATQTITLALGGPVDRQGRLTKVAQVTDELKD